MQYEYDFSNATKNPYTKSPTQSITINVDTITIDYFKGLADKHEIPYQVLMGLYLRDCAAQQRHL